MKLMILDKTKTDSNLHVFIYKHNVYKHTEAQIPKRYKHILSIFLSLIFVD